MKLSHLNALRALEASVRLGSFRAASTELNVSPAAVGQRIKGFENAAGLKLLERTHNGFVPTLLARQISAELEIGFRHVARALEMATRNNDPSSLSISAVPSIAEYWLVPRLPEFWQANPAMDLRLDSTSTILNPAEGHFDFSLRYGPEAPSEGTSIQLFPEFLLPICTPELAARITPDDADDPFRDVVLLHTDPSTSDPDWPDWQSWCEAMGYRKADTSSGAKITFTTLALRAMFAGHGVHLAQLSIALPALREGRVVAPFGAGMVVRTGFFYRLVAFEPRRQTTVQKSFSDWVQKEGERTEKQLLEFVGA